MSPQLIPGEVLTRYGPAVAGLRWVSLGAAEGLSGASVWRGEDADGPVLALKAWPPGTTVARLADVHAHLRRAGHLPFVPAVVITTDGSSVVVAAGRPWDLCRWMPGAADPAADPSPDRIANAAAAVAAVHRAWAPPAERLAACPAVLRRLHTLAARHSRRPTVRPIVFGPAVLDEAVRRAADAVARLGPGAAAALAPWAARPLPVRPCLVDVRRDHVLFTGDAVTGLVDFGAVQDDHPAADLARLLGELVGEDDGRFAAGLAAHAGAGGPPEPAPGFARLLDRTGVVAALAGWLVRLETRGPEPTDPAAAAARMVALATRAELFAAV